MSKIDEIISNNFPSLLQLSWQSYSYSDLVTVAQEYAEWYAAEVLKKAANEARIISSEITLASVDKKSITNITLPEHI